MDVVKIDGTIEPFDGSKLESSLLRAGASTAAAERIRTVIEGSLFPGARTQDIYKRAFSLLRSDARSVAARYSLRRALFEFGPSGHPFEDFVAQIFKKEGWNVDHRRVIQGQCITHEVDVYATRGNEYLAAELKYHNNPGYKTDIKVALYVKARFDDIWMCDPKAAGTCPIDRGFLITNTKFSSQVVEYAACAGIELMGWSVPEKGNLYDKIIETGVYPVTSLTGLKKAEKKLLIDLGIVAVDQLRERRDVLRELSVPPERIGAIVAEIESLRGSLT